MNEKPPRFGGFGLTTSDVARLSDFYQKVLRTTSEGDTEHAFVGEGDTAFALTHENPEIGASSHGDVVIIYDVDDVDEEYQRLCAMGVPILDPPVDRPWGMRNMMFSDPDGNPVVFRSPVK